MKKGDDHFAIEQSGVLIQVYVPASIADEWTMTDKVGFDDIVITSGGTQIMLLVEKDFECIDGKEEDNVGTYPNPRTTHSSP